MAYLKLAVAVIVSIFYLASNAVNTLLPAAIPESKTEAELQEMTDAFKSYPVSEEIFVVRTGKLGGEKTYAAIFLQGVVAKKSASIFVNTGSSGCTNQLRELEKAGYKLLYTDANGKEWDYELLVRYFAADNMIADNGYVLYTSKDDVNQLNMATNISALYGWLAVPAELEDAAKAAGLTKKDDLTDDKLDIAYQLDFYNEHKDEFRNDVLLHQQNGAQGLRDLAIQQNIFTMYVLEEDFIGKAFRTQVLSNMQPGSMVIGWCQYEIKFVENITSMGHYVIPSDHCYNNSLLSSVNYTADKLKTEETKAPELDPTKHYIAIVYSDGDNAQWVQGGYREFYDWQSYNIDVPITWTFPTQMNEFSAIDVQRAVDNNGGDCFIAGPSGAGYTRMSHMYGEGLAACADTTAAAMLKNGMTTLTILDGVPESSMTEKAFVNKLGYYARYSNIHGGILQLDPDRYSAGGGKVWFVNDKPFVSVRLSLWHPSGDETQVTNEWLKEQADTVNSYSADINSINGYSVINVHPWTVGPDDLAYFVSQLDDGVEVISADELIAVLSSKIPHQDAKPE